MNMNFVPYKYQSQTHFTIVSKKYFQETNSKDEQHRRDSSLKFDELFWTFITIIKFEYMYFELC